MILRPLAKIKVRGMVLKVGEKEFPFEVRHEYVSEDHEHYDRERCFSPDGHETNSYIDMLGHLSGLQNPSILLSCGPGTYVPSGYLLTDTYEYTLHSCNYYFRDLAQEEQEKKYPEGAYTKLPLEYLTNLGDSQTASTTCSFAASIARSLAKRPT